MHSRTNTACLTRARRYLLFFPPASRQQSVTIFPSTERQIHEFSTHISLLCCRQESWHGYAKVKSCRTAMPRRASLAPPTPTCRPVGGRQAVDTAGRSRRRGGAKSMLTRLSHYSPAVPRSELQKVCDHHARAPATPPSPPKLIKAGRCRLRREHYAYFYLRVTAQ
jgi:hypothetical protein